MTEPRRSPEYPRKDPRQDRSRSLCDAILVAAARIFDRLGYDAATTNHVAELAGVSVGSLYQYFPNKDALVTALHERHTEEVAAVLAAALAADLPTADVVRRLVADLFALHRERPRLQALLHGPAAFRERPAEDSPSTRALAAHCATWLRARGRTRGDMLDAYLLIQMTESLVHAAALEPPAFASAEALEDGVARALLAFIAA